MVKRYLSKLERYLLDVKRYLLSYSLRSANGYQQGFVDNANVNLVKV